MSINSNLCYSKVEESLGGYPEFKRVLAIRNDFTWNIYCNEHEIPSDSDIFSSIPATISSLSLCKYKLQLIDPWFSAMEMLMISSALL